MKKIKNVTGGGNVQPRPQQNNTRIVTTQSSSMPSVVRAGLSRMYSPSSAFPGMDTAKNNDEYTAHGIKKFHVPVKPQGDDPDGKAYERYERTIEKYMFYENWPGEPKDTSSAAWKEWYQESMAYLAWKDERLARQADARGEGRGIYKHCFPKQTPDGLPIDLNYD